MTLSVLSFFSGYCALSYEILYLRLLTTVLGDMFYVHAALLSTFLIGIGLGAKFAHKLKRWLFLAEGLTGAYAFLLPQVLKYISAHPFIGAITAKPLLTVFVTVVLLLLPSLLIGLSIPLFSVYIKKYDKGSPVFQGVYGAYNLGAMFGVLSIELVVVRLLGISGSLYIVGILNLINGLVLILLREGRSVPSAPVVIKRSAFAGTIILALALGSFASAIFQMFFLKLTYLVFEPHRENFAIGLGVSLLGLPLGALLVAKIRVRFETLLLMIPLLIGCIYVNYIPLLKLFHVTSSWLSRDVILLFVHKFIFGCFFALGPMILFGALLPALMQQEEEVALESGHLLWVSSLANAAGYLAYVFWGHPFLTTDHLLLLLAVMVLAGSLLAAGFRMSKERWGLALGGVLLMILVAGNWQEKNFYLAQWISSIQERDEVTIYKSGAESATMVRLPSEEWITYNGHQSIYVRQNGIVNRAERISGIISALNAPRLGRALVIGFGTGITAGTVSRIFTSTDVVEINDAFYRMMPDLHYANQNIEGNQAATLYLGDGRAFLAGKNDTYDAIINSVPAPNYFSASKLYTLEFYDRVVRALKPDGIFCTWLSIGDMSDSGIDTILSTLRQKFRYCELRIMRGSYFQATCSNAPLRSRQFSALPKHSFRNMNLLDLAGSFDLNEFFEDLRLSPNLFAGFSPTTVLNTDDKPVLEFMLIRRHQLRKMGDDVFLLKPRNYNVDAVKLDSADDPDRFNRRVKMFQEYFPHYYKTVFSPVIKQQEAKKNL